jgi:hypothetical protein
MTVATVESYIRPATLYRYRSLQSQDFNREIEAIRSATLYCAPYGSLNDPMEGFYTSSRQLWETN